MTPTFVMLHGFTGEPSRWDPITSKLASGGRVICPALFGHAIDTRRLHVHAFEDEVDRIAGALRDVREAHLVGYSLGARIALGLLLRHSKLFGRATLVGINPGLRSERERTERIEQDERWAELLERDGIEAFVDAWEAQPLFSSQRSLPVEIRDGERGSRLRHDPRSLARSLRVLGLGRMPCYWGSLSEVQVPLCLVVGELDTKFKALAVEMQTSLPRAMTEVVPGAGHNVVLERPGRMRELLER